MAGVGEEPHPGGVELGDGLRAPPLGLRGPRVEEPGRHLAAEQVDEVAVALVEGEVNRRHSADPQATLDPVSVGDGRWAHVPPPPPSPPPPLGVVLELELLVAEEEVLELVGLVVLEVLVGELVELERVEEVDLVELVDELVVVVVVE